MKAYYSDGRGRYNTGESYDWFYEYEDGNKKILTSSDHLWTYTYIDGNTVISLDSTFDGFYELKSVIVPEGIVSITGAFYGCEGLESITLPESLFHRHFAEQRLKKLVFLREQRILTMLFQDLNI